MQWMHTAWMLASATGYFFHEILTMLSYKAFYSCVHCGFQTATFQARGQFNELLFSHGSALSNYSVVLSWPCAGSLDVLLQPFCGLSWETGPLARVTPIIVKWWFPTGLSVSWTRVPLWFATWLQKCFYHHYLEDDSGTRHKAARTQTNLGNTAICMANPILERETCW